MISVRDEDFSRITDLLKQSTIHEQEDREYIDKLNNQKFDIDYLQFQTPQKHSGNQSLRNTTFQRGQQPKTRAKTWGIPYFSRSQKENENPEADGLNNEPLKPRDAGERAATLNLPNENTVRGVSGRFPKFTLNNTSQARTSTSEKDLPSRVLDESLLRNDLEHRQMQKVIKTITDQLTANNQQLDTLRASTIKDSERAQELKSQVLQLARLLSTALEERRDAIEYAFVKDQEALDLRTQLSRERRKNIKLMDMLLELQRRDSTTSHRNTASRPDSKDDAADTTITTNFLPPKQQPDIYDFNYYMRNKNKDKNSMERKPLNDLFDSLPMSRDLNKRPVPQEFDREKVQTYLNMLRRQAYEIQLRYGDSRPLTSIMDALDNAPNSRYRSAYLTLANILQHQLILLRLPDTTQVTTFIQTIESLLSMIP